MAQIDLKGLHFAIQKQNYTSPYLFLGEESWISDRGFHLLKKALVNPELADFNYKLFYGSECEMDDVIDELESYPVMSPHRFIIVKEGEALSEKDWDKLNHFIETNKTKNILLVIASGGDKRKKSFKKFLDSCTMLDCKSPFDNQRRSWLTVLADEENLSFSEEALSFWEMQGHYTLNEIAQEMKKIRNFLDDKGENKKKFSVELTDLQKLMPRFSEVSIFKFTEYLARKNFVKAKELLEKLIAQGESEVGMVQLLARHCRLLLKLQQGQHQGVKPQNLATFVGVSPYFLTDYQKQAQLWSYEDLKQWLVLLQGLDQKLKTSNLSPLIWWEQFILQLQSLNLRS